MCTDTPFLCKQFTIWFHILLIDGDVDVHDVVIDGNVDPHDVVIVHGFVAGNADDAHDDFTTDDAMLVPVYKYQTLLLSLM